MRKYNYESHKAGLKAEFYRNFEKLEPGRLPSRRKRDREDSDILTEMLLLRKKRWIKTSRLQELGPRKYRLIVSGA